MFRPSYDVLEMERFTITTVANWGSQTRNSELVQQVLSLTFRMSMSHNPPKNNNDVR